MIFSSRHKRYFLTLAKAHYEVSKKRRLAESLNHELVVANKILSYLETQKIPKNFLNYKKQKIKKLEEKIKAL